MKGSGNSGEQGGVDPLSGVELDPYSGEQLYRQLYSLLRAGILSGRWSEGEIIPSENELSARLGIARTTVRNAMALLVREGLVTQVRGKGTMVSHRPVKHSIWNFGSFTDLARANGKRPVNKVLVHEVENGSLKLVRARGLQSGADVQWLNVDTSWLSLALYPGIDNHDFETRSLYDVLRKEYDRHPARSEVQVSVVPPSPHLVEVFGTDPAVPGYICFTGDVLDKAGKEVERTSIVYSPSVDLKFATHWGAIEENE